MRAVDPAALAPQQRHRLLAGLARPHTVAVVSTADADGSPLVAPLGYCLPMRGERASVAITLSAVRDAGGEPEHVRAAALARGELVAHLTSADLAGHLAALAAAERDPTGAVRWTAVASRRVGVPSLDTGRARLECRVHGPAGPPGVPGVPAVRAPAQRGPAGSTSPTDYVLLAEVVCVVAEDDVLAAMGEPEPPVPRARPVPGTVFPWFLGPTDGSVVDGGGDGDATTTPGSPGRGGPLVIDAPPPDGPVTRR